MKAKALPVAGVAVLSESAFGGHAIVAALVLRQLRGEPPGSHRPTANDGSEFVARSILSLLTKRMGTTLR